MNQTYLDTARFLTQVAPLVFADDTFALKGRHPADRPISGAKPASFESYCELLKFNCNILINIHLMMDMNVF